MRLDLKLAAVRSSDILLFTADVYGDQTFEAIQKTHEDIFEVKDSQGKLRKEKDLVEIIVNKVLTELRGHY